MRTALDTNILSALWSRGPLAQTIAARLGTARGDGGLVISPVVFAELLAYPKATECFLMDFLAATGITVDSVLPEKVWLEAGRRFASYASRRRKSSKEGPKRLLADFIVGAHAMMQADRLMTLDPVLYQQDFPELHQF
ncbi:MAG: type II toxin-antitoxin system VapC family toxin [Acidobacteriaceae bacterium]